MASWIGFRGVDGSRKSVVPACRASFAQVTPAWTTREIAGEKRTGFLKTIGVSLDGIYDEEGNEVVVACPLADVQVLHTPKEIYEYFHQQHVYQAEDFLPALESAGVQ